MRFGESVIKSMARLAATNGRCPAVLEILLHAIATRLTPNFRTRIGRTAGKLCAATCFIGVLYLSSSSKAAWAQSADLSVTKTAPATVTQGQNIAYTLTVSNAGPDAAANAALSDTLPAGA